MTHDSFSIPEHTTLNPKAYAIYQLSCLLTSPSATLDAKACPGYRKPSVSLHPETSAPNHAASMV